MTDDLLDDAMMHQLETELIQDRGPGAEPECKVITGPAGTGKTTLVQLRVKKDPGYGLLTATTGIAAVNLGCVTLHSTIGYFDDNSLRDQYLSGRLTSRLRDLVRDGVTTLLIEEMSMLTGQALDILYRAAWETASASRNGRPLGLTLVGDFCQLPPIDGKWAFEADCWPQFSGNIERLNKVWRQDQGHFLEALTAARSGQGDKSVEILAGCGVQFNTSMILDMGDVTTIVPKNDQVDRFNAEALSRVPGPPIHSFSRRWGKLRGEWKNIPDRLTLKIGAYVMILANETETFSYVNGDCGHVVDYHKESDDSYGPGMEWFDVKLKRTGRIVSIYPIVRNVEQKDKPDRGPVSEFNFDAREYHKQGSDAPWRGTYRSAESGNVQRRAWVMGQVEYMPLRSAYATTVHKSQGLSLDAVQIDYRHQFFKSPAMLYVALSRCRTVEGLRLVGMKEKFVQHCTTDPKVKEWL